MVKKTFEWDSIKTIFTTAIETIGKVAVAALKAVFQTIPEMLGAMVSGVLQWITYIAMNIQASILGAIEGAVNKAGEKIQELGLVSSSGLVISLSPSTLEAIKSEQRQRP